MGPAGTAIGSGTWWNTAVVRNADGLGAASGRRTVVEEVGVARGELRPVEVTIGDGQLEAVGGGSRLAGLCVLLFFRSARETAFALAFSGAPVAGHAVTIIALFALRGVDVAIAAARNAGRRFTSGVAARGL